LIAPANLAMRKGNDIIRRILDLVKETEPSFTEQCALQVELQIRHEYGGEQITVAKRAPLLAAAKEKVRGQIGIRSIGELCAEHGISRATLYRWISK
jgi:hypothetical protein